MSEDEAAVAEKAPTRLRVFISSPGDVPDERLRADLIIDRLAQECRRFFTLEGYRWEHEPMLASGHFQDAIEPPSAFDIVILILWSRLGTQLPERTSMRAYAGMDGRVPVTGTEWEYEDALRVAREKGAPNILAFRNVSPALVATNDLAEQTRSLAQLAALNEFWTRHFADRGVFLSAYDTYHSLEEFSERLERSLRKLIERHIDQAGGQQMSATVWRNSPFRGLEAYEFEHAAIYFGREALVARATEQLAAEARAGRAFLLVSGASGSGKSSMVKAGMMPRLMRPQRIQGSAFVRRLAFRPSQGGSDIFYGLVEALTKQPTSPDVGLPELLGPGQSVADLVSLLRTAVDEPGFVFAGALGRVGEAGRQSGRILAYEEAKLILVIDQLEELFTVAAIPVEDQRLFIRLLAGLARSGAVWVVATLRSDFWHGAAELPELVELCAGNGRIDIATPSQAEIVEMIRNPALMAGLSFGLHEKTHLGLDAVLAQHAASEPGVLPLLSFTLEALYVEDVEKRGGRILTHATYESLGGLEGAITKRADEVVSQLPEATQKALPRVLRSLATVSEGDNKAVVSRTVPRDTFAPGSDARAIVDALTEERLLVASGEGVVPTVRFAHEALINNWHRARNQLVADRRDLETRAMIEHQQARWLAAPEETSKQLLLRDPDLANAIDLVGRWDDELSPEFREFVARSVKASQDARRRRRAIVSAVISVLAVLTVASFAAMRSAEVQRNEALITQSKSLTRESQLALAAGDDVSATVLALAGLPQRISSPDRPFVDAPQYALEDAFENRRDGFVLTEHAGTVWSATYSPDGERVAVAYDDGSARIWDSATGNGLAILKGHTGRVWMAVFSPDGKRVATASDDETGRIWNSATGATVAVLKGHQEVVSAIAFSPDGTRVATASDDQTARIWDASTGNPIAVLRGHTGPLTAIAYSPDGTQLATSSTDGTARLWNAASGAPVATLAGHQGVVNSVSYSPDGRHVVTASWDKTARIWDAHSGASVAILRGHENFVLSAAFSPDGARVVTASADDTAIVWDAETGELETFIIGHGGSVESARFSPDGMRVLTASDDDTARLWDAKSGALYGILGGHTSYLNSAVFSPDGIHILTASYDGTARLWDTQPQDVVAVLKGHTDVVQSVAYSPDGSRVATGSFDHFARIWDVKTAESLQTLPLGANVHAVAFSPDGRRLITGSDDSVVLIWDVKSGAPLEQLLGHGGGVFAVAFSPDGRRAISGSKDQTARVWDLASGKTLLILRGHEGVVSAVAFSPDGKRVLTGSWDGTARVWDSSTGALLAKLIGHEDRIAGAAWSPDGKRIVTASQDKTARLWDAASGRPISVFRGHDQALNSAQFSPDGLRIVTSSNDETARIWDVETAMTIATLREHGDAVRDAAFSPDGLRIVTASSDATAALARMAPRCQALIDASRDGLHRRSTEKVKDVLERPTSTPLLDLFNTVFPFILPKIGDRCE